MKPKLYSLGVVPADVLLQRFPERMVIRVLIVTSQAEEVLGRRVVEAVFQSRHRLPDAVAKNPGLVHLMAALPPLARMQNGDAVPYQPRLPRSRA